MLPSSPWGDTLPRVSALAALECRYSHDSAGHLRLTAVGTIRAGGEVGAKGPHLGHELLLARLDGGQLRIALRLCVARLAARVPQDVLALLPPGGSGT